MKTTSSLRPLSSRPLRSALLPLGLILLGACGIPDPTPTPAQPAPTLPQEFACEDDDLKVSLPMTGPGFDSATGSAKAPVQEHYLAVTTLIVVGEDPNSGPRINELIGGMVGPLMGNPGLVAMSLSGSAKCGYGRTISIWKDEASMYAFFTSPLHVAAMNEAPAISRGSTSTHWEVSAQDVNISWDVARAKLNEALLSR
ncbi:hypothetical protein [Melittangium boletus]|uniref:Lipoprotein n=1 Tax=Melittangium boletus DSM 14713 TaxID=1294270 RepID=A0A250IQ94_9BACT|nr:hypothetical protein [Melittangium boletus]ATB33925.1 hypothetical protein MEBOL_007426 [Melittangium boletus DSM 14713]